MLIHRFNLSPLCSFHFSLRYCTLEITANLGDYPFKSSTLGWLWRVEVTIEVNRNGTCCWKWSIKALSDMTEWPWILANRHFFFHSRTLQSLSGLRSVQCDLPQYKIQIAICLLGTMTHSSGNKMWKMYLVWIQYKMAWYIWCSLPDKI